MLELKARLKHQTDLNVITFYHAYKRHHSRPNPPALCEQQSPGRAWTSSWILFNDATASANCWIDPNLTGEKIAKCQGLK